MIKTAETDIISPAVTAEDPYGLLGEVVLVLKDISLLIALAVALFELSNECSSCSCILSTVVYCCEVLISSCLDLSRCLVACSDFLYFLDESLTDSLLTEIHTETVLSVVLEQ